MKKIDIRVVVHRVKVLWERSILKRPPDLVVRTSLGSFLNEQACDMYGSGHVRDVEWAELTGVQKRSEVPLLHARVERVVSAKH